MTREHLRHLFPFASPDFLERNADAILARSDAEEQSAARGASTGILERKKAQSHEVHTRSKAPSPKPQQTPIHEPMAEEKGKGGPPRRLLVRITSVRRRLLDYDNLIGKYFVDCLRYCGILSDDTEAEIDLRISQRKTKIKDDEKTIIEIEYLP